MNQSGTQAPPPRKEEVFTSLVLVPVFLIYKSKWHFCSAGLIFLRAGVTIENRAPRRRKDFNFAPPGRCVRVVP